LPGPESWFIGATPPAPGPAGSLAWWSARPTLAQIRLHPEPRLWNRPRLVALAQVAVPGARPTIIELSDNAARPALVVMKFAEDHTPAGRTCVFLDAYSGKVLALNSSRAAPPPRWPM